MYLKLCYGLTDGSAQFIMGLATGYTYPVSLQFCDEEQFECTVQKMHLGLIGSQVHIGMMYTGSKAHADEAKETARTCWSRQVASHQILLGLLYNTHLNQRVDYLVRACMTQVVGWLQAHGTTNRTRAQHAHPRARGKNQATNGGPRAWRPIPDARSRRGAPSRVPIVAAGTGSA